MSLQNLDNFIKDTVEPYQYQELIELVPEVIYKISTDGNLISLNPAFEKITGWKVKDWLNKPFIGIVHPGDIAKAFSKFQQSVKGERISDPYELRILKKDGSYIIGEFVSAPLYENNQIIGKIGIGRDVTDRKMAEERLNKLAAIIESSDDAIMGQKLEGIITSWNPGAEKLYGFTAKEIVGQTVLKIVPEDKKEEFYQIMEVARIGGSIDHLETVRKHKDGRRIDISLTLSPIVDSSGEIFGVSEIGRDITIQKELERRKDAFIGMASHELKTPITTLKAFTQLLMQLESKKNGTFFKYLSKMDEELNRLTELVTELLDLSKIQVGRLALNKEKFDLDEMIKDTAENVQGITKKHKIQIDGKSEKVLFGDKRRLNQVLLNLLTNAIKYSPEGDKVVVKVLPDNNKVTVSITDFGIGIAKKHQLRIFDRFYRAAGLSEKTFPGLGIGLYISAEIIRRHGGQIWVESIKRKGSTFSFALPLK